jgi:acetyl-CoA carboxylase biotin carboxyl carrier protein
MPKSINADAIRQLAALLKETGLSEIEYATGNLRIRVSRESPAAGERPLPQTMASDSRPLPAPPLTPNTEDASHPGAILSPMVGTAYLSPKPGEPAFVSAGEHVKQGQTLLLVEAMKTFNEIKSPRAGVVRKILVENQQPVEYGELLMIVE